MRWLILTDDHPPMVGGIATFVARLARGLVDRGDQVEIVARAGAEPVPGTRLIAARGPRFGRYAGRWLALAAGSRLFSADRIVATTWVAATTASRLGRPLAILAHGSDVTRPPVRAHATFLRTWRAACQRFAVSDFLVERLREHHLTARRLPWPVDPLACPPPPRQRHSRWAFVGRLTPLKGVDRFVRWVAAAGVQGVVVGHGKAMGPTVALARQLRADVQFLGRVSLTEVQTLWPEVDLLVLAPRADPDGSGAEGLGTVLLEAAAHGVPSVGCATGGVPEGAGLIVGGPDDAAASVREIDRWWTPMRGREAWERCRERHGTAKTLAALDDRAP
ncbi:MAG: glycosyltransferase family 4 protein [Myxococcota bacterium]